MDILKMATFGDNVLSEENLYNIDNDNEGDDDVDESSSDIKEMKKILKNGKKRGRQSQREDQHVNDPVETRKKTRTKKTRLHKIINHRKTKRCRIKLLKNLRKSMSPIFLFLSNRFGSN